MRSQRLIDAIGPYPFSLGAVALATAVLLPLRPILEPTQVMLLLVPLIVWLARLVGMRTSIAAAVLAFLAVDLLFVPPYYHITVSSPVDWVTLVLFLAVAVAAGSQTGGMRDRERAALQRQRELALLNRLSSHLVTEDSEEAVAAFTVKEVVAVLDCDVAAVFVKRASGDTVLLAQGGSGDIGVAEAAFANWVIRHAKAIGLPPMEWAAGQRLVSVAASDAIEGVSASGVYVPLRSSTAMTGVLHARASAGREISVETARQLVAIANLTAMYLERMKLEEAASRALAVRESDRLKQAFVSSVSHELKTPLAAVSARVTGLLDEGQGCSSERVRSELLSVAEDLGRLDSSIRDLVDVSRLESDTWKPKLDTYDISELYGLVGHRMPVDHRGLVTFERSEGLPRFRADLNQLSRAVLNMVENALAYGAGPVRIGARVLGGSMLLWVEDHGTGIPEGEKSRVFDKFYRGSTSGASSSGTGLGLAIVQEVARMHGGRAWVEDVDPTGARFVLSLRAFESVT